MLGLGWPIIGVNEIYEYEEGGGILHAKVMCGAFINRKGKVIGIYVNDPISEKKATQGANVSDKWEFQIIVSRTLEQSDICPYSERLLSGGEVPPPRRQLHPSAVPGNT